MNFISNQYSKYNNNNSSNQSSGFQRSRPNTTRPFCPICKKNGRPESEYNSHFIRETSDENSPITCPILQSMECNHCGDKGHIAAKCPNKRCVYCNQFGHTVSRCTAGSKEMIDSFLEQRHHNYEQRRENVFQRPRFMQAPPAPAPPPAPSITAMFEDAPSLSKKPTKTNSAAPVVSYSVVAEIAAPLAIPKKKVDTKVDNEDDYEDDSDEYIEYNDDDASVHSNVKPRNEEDMTLSEKMNSYYEDDANDW
jgi:hypothetical protein